MNKLITTSLLALSVVFFTSCNEGNASSKVKKENVDTAKKRDTEISKGAAEIQFNMILELLTKVKLLKQNLR